MECCRWSVSSSRCWTHQVGCLLCGGTQWGCRRTASWWRPNRRPTGRQALLDNVDWTPSCTCGLCSPWWARGWCGKARACSANISATDGPVSGHCLSAHPTHLRPGQQDMAAAQNGSSFQIILHAQKYKCWYIKNY